MELEIISKEKVNGDFVKSSDCKILAKYLGNNHWSVYEFHRVVNGNIYVAEKECSRNSIYSPCYRKVINGSRDKLNQIWVKLKMDGYVNLGEYEMNICGGFR